MNAPSASSARSASVGPQGALGRFFSDNPFAICITLAGLVTWVFWPALNHQFVNYDDPDYITTNRHIQSGLNWTAARWAFTTTYAANWHPLTWLSHMLDCQLYGLEPWGHHLTSVFLHVTNTVLVFLVFRSMTRASGRSFALAALFGLHPLRVQSVAWVSERKDVLSTLFFLLTLWAYAYYARASMNGHSQPPGGAKPVHDSRRIMAAYAASLIFFALGLMSKPMLVTLPFVLLLLDFWPLHRLQASALPPKLSNIFRLLAEKIPFFLLAAASGAVTFMIQNGEGAVWQRLPLAMRVENALIGYCRYLGKLFWPAGLSVFYPFPAAPWPMFEVVLASLLIAGVSVLALALARRWPYFPVGWLWFLGTLVPVIGVIQVGEQSIADRYTYIPSVGILVVFVWAGWDLLQNLSWRTAMAAATALASVAIVCCLVATRHELVYWSDGETLFRRALAVTGPSAMCLDALGEELSARKHLDESIPLYEQAIRLSPDFADAWQDLGADLLKQGKLDDTIALFRNDIHVNPESAEAHRNLGAALSQAGDWAEAGSEFTEAIRLRPAYAAAHRGLGLTLRHQQREDEAMNEYQAAIRLDPEAHDHGAVAEILAREGRLDDAMNQLRQAVQLEPTNANAHLALGQLLTQRGSMDEAIGEYEITTRLAPNLAQAHYFLGGALAEKGRSDEAIVQFRAALLIQPEYADAQNDLGMALDAKGQSEEAIGHLREAARLKPDDPQTHDNLGVSLCNAGRTDDGIAQFREALRLSPDNPSAQSNLNAILAAKINAPKN